MFLLAAPDFDFHAAATTIFRAQMLTFTLKMFHWPAKISLLLALFFAAAVIYFRRGDCLRRQEVSYCSVYWRHISARHFATSMPRRVFADSRRRQRDTASV
jgi:hypothetical protein